MCSRYCLTSPAEAVRHVFGHQNDIDFPPRYNIAPTQPVPILRVNAKGARELTLVRWGLIPAWVKDPAAFSTLINARSETATQKPSFRAAMRYRRCLVPADGFYEWTGPKGAKQPHLIRAKAGGLLAFAGIFEHWMGPDGSEMETMAILTTKASETVSTVHDRMPVILAPSRFEVWLDCKSGKADAAAALLAPAPEDLLEIIAVNPKLNNPRHDGPELQEPPSA